MERLAEMAPPLEDRGSFLREIAMGFEKGQIFLTALDLDIFSKLMEPKSAETLAEELETNPELTARFLDVLTALDVLVKKDDTYCTAPSLAPFLLDEGPYSAKYLKFSKEDRDTWTNLGNFLKNGPSGNGEESHHKHDYTPESIDWIACGTMLGRLQATLKAVRELPEFAKAKKIIDLGGGHGLFGIGFAQENPELEVLIFDQPGITDVTEKYINKYLIQERVRTMTGDYLKDDLGSGYDIAFEACSFGGNTEQARNFYRRVADSLNEGGLFITQTFTLDDDRTAPLSSLIWALKEKITGSGHMHLKTNSELFETLAGAGLSGIKVIDMSESCTMPMRLVVARKGA
ncbi:MAG: methyltransferase [Methanosarcinaceae archaeon]